MQEKIWNALDPFAIMTKSRHTGRAQESHCRRADQRAVMNTGLVVFACARNFNGYSVPRADGKPDPGCHAAKCLFVRMRFYRFTVDN